MSRLQLLTCVLSGALLACAPDRAAEQVANRADTLPYEDPFLAMEDYSPPFRQLVLTEEGTWRGLDLGVSFETLLARETADVKDEADSLLMVSVNLDSTMLDLDSAEFADITYSFAQDTLREVHVEVYLTSDTSLKNLTRDFVDFYNKKYAPAVNYHPQDSLYVWQTPGGQRLRLQRRQRGIDRGLTFEISKL